MGKPQWDILAQIPIFDKKNDLFCAKIKNVHCRKLFYSGHILNLEMTEVLLTTTVSACYVCAVQIECAAGFANQFQYHHAHLKKHDM